MPSDARCSGNPEGLKVSLQTIGAGEQHRLPAGGFGAVDILLAVVDEDGRRRLQPKGCGVVVVDGAIGLDQADLAGNRYPAGLVQEGETFARCAERCALGNSTSCIVTTTF